MALLDRVTLSGESSIGQINFVALMPMTSSSSRSRSSSADLLIKVIEPTLLIPKITSCAASNSNSRSSSASFSFYLREPSVSVRLFAFFSVLKALLLSRVNSPHQLSISLEGFCSVRSI